VNGNPEERRVYLDVMGLLQQTRVAPPMGRQPHSLAALREWSNMFLAQGRLQRSRGDPGAPAKQVAKNLRDKSNQR